VAGPDALVAAYFDAWNRHDGDGLAAQFAADGTFSSDFVRRSRIICSGLATGG
jgi:ketosteroid isomerase-like protein